MKTLYEILEVSENASQEVIEKAYKVLAKRYHPDLQAEENKQEAERHMKELNEAYEILGDENKKKDYDEKLASQRQEKKVRQEMQKNMQTQYEQKYQEAYEDYLRSLGYKIKYKWTWKNYKDFLITILIIIGICAILWLFPPTHKLIMDFYNSNQIIKTIIDIIGNIFKGIWNATCSIFK